MSQPDHILVIWNPSAGSAQALDLLRQELGDHPGVTLEETKSGEDLAAFARKTDCDFVIAAGGDGTVNGVLAGLLQNPRRPALGILPIGTGNDFARSLGMPLDPQEAAVFLLTEPDWTDVDVIRVENAESEVAFLNLAAGGNSHLVSEATTAAAKERWGALSYVGNALSRLGELVVFDATLRFDDGPEEKQKIINIVVANGQTVAGGIPICPTADPRDGLFDVLLFLEGSVADHAALAAQLLVGLHLESERVIHRRASRLEIDASPTLAFSCDGELLDPGAMTFSVMPGAQRVAAPAVAPLSS